MTQHRQVIRVPETPIDARLRRRRRNCCCCGCTGLLITAVVAVIVLRGPVLRMLHVGGRPPTPHFTMPIEVTTEGNKFWRCDLVPIVVTLRDPQGRAVAVAQPPKARVLRNEEIQSTVGHVEVLTLKYDRRDRVYRAWWPVPFNAEPGIYTVEVRRNLTVPEAWQWDRDLPTPRNDRERQLRLAEAVARASFRVVARQPAAIAPGTCAVTWEPHPPAGKLRNPDGVMTEGWKALVQWAEFMGADMLWMRAAVTEAQPGRRLTLERPFVMEGESILRRAAREAHARGIRFGAWVVAYATLPFHRSDGKPPYRYAIDEKGSPREDFISLLDGRRPKDIARVFQQLAADPNVDLLGLDYFRPGPDGYEIVDSFAQVMPLAVPEAFFKWPLAKRRSWVAERVERQWRRDRDVLDQWNWYRAHLVANRLREIRSYAKTDKPVWVFAFGWERGWQAGQDPLMLTDAGADAIAVMLYQCESPEHFRIMTDQWHEYLRSGQAQLLPGDQVDFYWHQKMIRPRAAPEELYRRIVTAHAKFLRDGVTPGAFWHDISRAAVRGNLGPYPGREWALAGAAAFSTVRRSWGVYPIAAQVVAPESATVGAPFTVTVRIRNLVRKAVRGVKLSVESTPQIESLEQEASKTADIPAHGELSVPWKLKIGASNPRRGNRYMVAFRLRWPDADYGDGVRRDLPRTIVVIRYVDGR